MKLQGWKGLMGWWWLYLTWPLRKLWVKLYRAVREGDVTRFPEVPNLETYLAIKTRLKRQQYTEDGIKQLGDATHSARWLHANWGHITSGSDCDDFAEYGSALVKAARSQLGDVHELYVLIVIWKNGSGHAVTLIRTADGYRWMDYGMPGHTHATLESVLDEVTRWYAGDEVVAWVADPR